MEADAAIGSRHDDAFAGLRRNVPGGPWWAHIAIIPLLVSCRNQVPQGNKVAKSKSAGPETDIRDICASMPTSKQHELREPLARLLDNWSLWVLAELCDDGPLRFSRLLERLQGVSQKSLTATLRALERDGLITRTVVVQVPIRVDYAATELAKKIVQEVQPIWLGSVAKFRWSREDGLNTSGADHVRVQVASL